MKDFPFSDDELFMMYTGLCHMERDLLEFIKIVDNEDIERVKNDIEKIKKLRLKVSKVSHDL